MSDFETHPVGYVAHLKQKIFDLEQELEKTTDDASHWHKKYLEGGCRFNCRTAKEAFIAGVDYGREYRYSKDAIDSYKEWKNEQT